MKFLDWYIAVHVGLTVIALLTLAFLHPDPAVVGAVCGAVPATLGFYHWFVFKDSKTPDA
jgi:hypothetical protein